MQTELLGPWRPYLEHSMQKPYFSRLAGRVDAAYAAGEVYPPEGDLFRAFSLCPPERVRAVILGQDPYHEPGQAMGLAFSVPDGVPLPPSLRNIYKELALDLGVTPPPSGDLTRWARQGVLLLNTVLTVERGRANSHAKYGWQTFTDDAIAAAGSLPQPVAFILWGAQAQKKRGLIADAGARLVIESAHPSPLSSYRGFFGSRPFSQVNAFLREHGAGEIAW